MHQKQKTIFIIAGEMSGDALGAWLMKQLKDVYGPIHFIGVGGPQMKALGQEQVLNAKDLSYFGFVEVLANLPKILKQRRQVLQHLHKAQPQLLLTIDLPDFNFSIGKKAKRMNIPVVHVGAPSVWAWRAKRAEKISQFLSHLLCLLPFEPQYFTRVGLPAVFIGHPLMHHKSAKKVPKKQTPSEPCLLLLPGSRVSEVKNHLSLMLDAAAKLHQKNPHLKILLLQTDNVWTLAHKILMNHPLRPHVHMLPYADQAHAFHSATLALAASGTVTLELAVHHIPMVIVYKLNKITGWLAKCLLTTKMVGLPNIILNKLIFPELLQSQCTVDNMVNQVQALLENPHALTQQKQDMSRIDTRLHLNPEVLTKMWHKVFDSYLDPHDRGFL